MNFLFTGIIFYSHQAFISSGKLRIQNFNICFEFLLSRMGLKREKLQTEAVSRLQGELAKDGRTPFAPLVVPEKTAAGAGTVSKRTVGRKGTCM